MARSAGQRPSSRRGGVALGVLGIMLLAFFAVVFMLGRPGYWKSFNDLVHHPFDPHPIGIDKRHKEMPLSQSSTQTELPVTQTTDVEVPKVDRPGAETTSSSQTAGAGTSGTSTVVVDTASQAKASTDAAEASQTSKASSTVNAPVAKPEDKPASVTRVADPNQAEAQSTSVVQVVTTKQEVQPTSLQPVRTEPAKVEPVRTEPVKVEPVRTEPVKVEPVKTEPVKVEPVKTEPVKVEPVKTEPVKVEPVKVEPAKTEPVKVEPAKTEPVKVEPAKTEPVKTEPVKTESTKQEAADDGEEDGQVTALDNEYKPTREMVQRIAQNGYLMVTWANYHYFDFVQTWVRHVQAVGVTGYIVGAMDDHLLREMIKLKYNCFSMKSGLTLGDFGWGSPTFAKMGREKIRLISIFLQLDVNVVIADVDVLWLRNPLPYFDRYPEADILTSSDSTFATVKDDSLEKWPEAGAAANIGIMLFRKKSLDFVEKWIEIIEADEKVWDQNAFNDLFRKGWKLLNPPNKNLFLGYDGTLTLGILPVSLFCSGHTMFVQRLGHTLGMQPYAVHATFQFSGTPGKRHRMREFMLYGDPPEYYDHSVGFISFDFDGLPELLKEAGPATNKMDLANVQGHFKLVNHEMLRLRTAFAISTVLHRALVVPPLWCGLDRWWAPHAGRIPGSEFTLPFQCPLDHVIDLENGVFKDLPEDTFGPRTEIREHSFFQNPSMTARVRDDKVLVEICPPGTAGCSDGSKPAELQIDGGVPKVRVQGGLPSSLLETALLSVKSTKVLHFRTMANAMGDFSDPEDTKRFNSRMKLYGSIWCCVMAHPGHIHYDMLWDLPHEDKFQRAWNGTWETITGP